MKKIEKTLANCEPREFLVQANKIRKSVEKWLTLTDIMNIRRTPMNIPEGLSEDEKKAELMKQSKANLSRILDACLEEHIDETLEVLALVCFIEPKEINKYPMAEIIRVAGELISDESVLSFFTSLTKLGQMF